MKEKNKYNILLKTKRILIGVQIIFSIFIFIIGGMFFFDMDLYTSLGFSFLLGFLVCFLGNIFYSVIFWGVWFFGKNEIDFKEKLRLHKILESKFKNFYNIDINNVDEIFINKTNNSIKILQILTGSNEVENGLLCKIYKKDNYLNLFIAPSNSLKLLKLLNIEKLTAYSIEYSKLEYYTTYGEKYLVSNVSGGGASLGGAILGGVLAGGVGAIIGGNKKITTEVKTIDERNTKLYFYDNENLINIIMNYASFDILKKLFPKKDLMVIQNKLINNNEDASTTDQIEKFYELKEKGVISQEEFDIQKNKLLRK